MNQLLEISQAISALSFVGYGTACLISQKMRGEFLRFGLPQLRVFTGVLQIAAGLGLLFGYAYPLCALLASAGLILMMTAAIGVRLKIKDPVSGFLQALTCFLLNLFIFRGYLARLFEKH